MFKFIYFLVAYCLTNYDDMPGSFKQKFPKEIFKESSLLFSYSSDNIKFIYCLVAYCLTHYDDMPGSFKQKFPKEIFKESSLLFSYLSDNINVFKNFGYE